MENYFIAPVAYISMDENKDFNLLKFLGELTHESVNAELKFTLRLWHYWKYFFKYDFYKEEKEIRLLYITKSGQFEDKNMDNKEAKYEWSESKGLICYVEKSLDDMPFSINKLILGPKIINRDSARKNLYMLAEGRFNLDFSEIIKYC